MSNNSTFLVGGSENKPSDPQNKLIFYNFEIKQFEVFDPVVNHWVIIEIEHLIN